MMDISAIEKLKAYEIVSREKLDDIQAEGILLRHRKTGARVALIPCEDDNKVFNIAFRTPPEDSTGVAHIIEHTVLCGSEEFPIRDPFVELVKGSLNTFLNAMTYPDKTMYPVASTNDADFRNLMHVYLDAVFFPNIYREKNIFRQEGWRYEMHAPDEPLTINGVVYNEMKGAFSTPESVLERESMNVLFPDTAYGVESGGDPSVIPELTYEAYLDFHRRYYHPSNSYIYLYGNADMAGSLAFIDEHYLSRFDRLEIDSSLRVQKPFAEMKKLTRDYPSSEEGSRNAYLSYSVVGGNPLDQEEMIACDVLDYALLSAPGAPLKKAILDEGLGLDVMGGFTDGVLQPYFTVTAKNAEEKDASRFEETIRRVLNSQAEGGIDPAALLAGINLYEFQFREGDYAGFPKGLFYGLDLFDTWLYDDGLPFKALQNRAAAYASLRDKIGDGYFEDLVRRLFLDNPHSVLLTLRPKKGMAAEAEKALADRLKEIRDGMSKEEVQRIIDETEALEKWQSEPELQENLDRIPVLSRSEIDPQGVVISNEEAVTKVKGADGRDHEIRTVFHNAKTNGIVYLTSYYDVLDVAAEDIPYLSLLRGVLMNTDTEAHSYIALNNEVNGRTGGISFSLSTESVKGDAERYQAFLCAGTKAFSERLADASELMGEIISSTKLDDAKRIREIISQARSSMQVTLQSSGNRAASMRACAYFSAKSAFEDLSSGVSFYRFLCDLEEHYEEKSGEIRSALERLYRTVFDESRMLVSVTCDPADRALIPAFLAPMANGRRAEGKPSCVRPLGDLNEGFTTPGQVQFVARAGSFRRDGHEYGGLMPLTSQILNYEYLWQRIRVKGGAYGCSAAFRQNGDSWFVSYRDPNLTATKDVFEAIPAYLGSFEADEKQMTKYVIGTISALDTPLTPSMLGSVSMTSYLRGTTQEMLDARRRQVLEATDEDVRSMARVVEDILKEGALCVIGGETAVREASKIFGKTEKLL